jgi:hypothetical protein
MMKLKKTMKNIRGGRKLSIGKNIKSSYVSKNRILDESTKTIMTNKDIQLVLKKAFRVFPYEYAKYCEKLKSFLKNCSANGGR